MARVFEVMVQILLRVGAMASLALTGAKGQCAVFKLRAYARACPEPSEGRVQWPLQIRIGYMSKR